MHYPARWPHGRSSATASWPLILKSALKRAVRLVVVACVSLMLSVDDDEHPEVCPRGQDHAQGVAQPSGGRRWRARPGTQAAARRPSAVGHAPKRRRASVAAMGAPPFRRASSFGRSLSARRGGAKHAAEVPRSATRCSGDRARAGAAAGGTAPPRSRPERRGSIGAPGVAARVRSAALGGGGRASRRSRRPGARSRTSAARPCRRGARRPGRRRPRARRRPRRPQSQLARTGALPDGAERSAARAFRPASQLARTGALRRRSRRPRRAAAAGRRCRRDGGAARGGRRPPREGAGRARGRRPARPRRGRRRPVAGHPRGAAVGGPPRLEAFRAARQLVRTEDFKLTSKRRRAAGAGAGTGRRRRRGGRRRVPRLRAGPRVGSHRCRAPAGAAPGLRGPARPSCRRRRGGERRVAAAGRAPALCRRRT